MNQLSNYANRDLIIPPTIKPTLDNHIQTANIHTLEKQPFCKTNQHKKKPWEINWQIQRGIWRMHVKSTKKWHNWLIKHKTNIQGKKCRLRLWKTCNCCFHNIHIPISNLLSYIDLNPCHSIIAILYYTITILTKLGMEIHLGFIVFKSLNLLIFMMLTSLMSSKCIFGLLQKYW
jgi:hypothetical protein